MAFRGRRYVSRATRGSFREAQREGTQPGGWWPASTPDDAANPQKCGLSGRPLEVGMKCYFLVCLGSEPVPDKQIETSRKEDGYNTGYRMAPDGFEDVTKADGTTYSRKKWKYQEQNEAGGWHDIVVWSNAVIHAEAEARGYKAPKLPCRRFSGGDRTRGVEHQVAQAPIAPLEELAVADEVIVPGPKAPEVTEPTVAPTDLAPTA